MLLILKYIFDQRQRLTGETKGSYPQLSIVTMCVCVCLCEDAVALVECTAVCRRPLLHLPFTFHFAESKQGKS